MLKRLRTTLTALLLVLAGAASAVAGNVVVIHGEESLAPAERPFALALARQAMRLYGVAGLTVPMGGDSRLDELLPGSRVAVLIQVANPSARQLASLRGYVRGGGRLIVCYSASSGLAALMGVAVGGYVKGDAGGRWARMRFEALRPQGVPETIQQSSPNLALVNPVAGSSQVLAWWEDRAGRRAAEPAWLVSKHGYWMTHVLFGDGDADYKAQLLLALAASCDPSLWQVAASRRLTLARRVGSFATVADVAVQARRVDDSARRAVVLATGRAAADAEQRALQSLRDGRGYAAWQQAGALRAQMELAYGWMQTPVAGEMRGVWDHSGAGLFPGDWGRTCQTLKDGGISDLFLCVGGPGFAHYRSGILPPSRLLLEQGDQLAACLAAAKPRGLRVHAWILCFSAEQATEERMAFYRGKGWLLTGEDGVARRWLDPAVPEARQLIVQAAREIALRYAVDGIHLDFVRYPGFSGSLGPSVRRRFEADLGRHVPNWPAEVQSSPRRLDFIRWRCNRVTDLVAETRNMLRREAPGRLLTAAVYGKYPSCAETVGQDWESWLRQGYVDFLLPMNYTDEMDKFQELLGNQTRARWLRKHMLPGLGVTAAESRLDAAQVIDQIAAVRKAGCPGFALFDLDTYLDKNILPVLRVGVTAK